MSRSSTNPWRADSAAPAWYVNLTFYNPQPRYLWVAGWSEQMKTHSDFKVFSQAVFKRFLGRYLFTFFALSTYALFFLIQLLNNEMVLQNKLPLKICYGYANKYSFRDMVLKSGNFTRNVYDSLSFLSLSCFAFFWIAISSLKIHTPNRKFGRSFHFTSYLLKVLNWSVVYFCSFSG